MQMKPTLQVACNLYFSEPCIHQRLRFGTVLSHELASAINPKTCTPTINPGMPSNRFYNGQDSGGVLQCEDASLTPSFLPHELHLSFQYGRVARNLQDRFWRTRTTSDTTISRQKRMKDVHSPQSSKFSAVSVSTPRFPSHLILTSGIVP